MRNNEYTPVHLSENNSTTTPAAASSFGQQQGEGQHAELQSSINVDCSATQPNQQQQFQQQSAMYYDDATPAPASASASATTSPIVIAVAVPNTIRPPKVSLDDNYNTDPRSFILRRFCIFVIGLALTYLTFFESIVLMLFGYVNGSFLELVLGVLWFAATIGVLIGSFVGAYRGKWRLLVPGLILQHIMGLATKMLISNIPDNDGYYGVLD